MSPAELKILDFSAQVIATQDTPEFWPAVQALKDAIHEHTSSMRDKVADLAFVMAKEDGLKAA